MPPRTDWREEIPPGEEQQLEALAQQLRALQQRISQGAGRALHLKSHVGIRAEFVVLPDLPPHARVGIFASPGSYQAWARYSNGGPLRTSDHKPDVRGLALKLLGVPGRKLIPGMEDATTQDFLLINTPKQSFRNADEFVFFVLAAQNQLTLLPKAIARLGFGRTLDVIRSFTALGKPGPSLATRRLWSSAPIRWGDYAARYGVVPLAPPPPAGPLPPSADYLADDLAQRLSQGAVEYDFAVQFYSDAVKTPIEDASVEWKEDDAPFVRVARVVIPKQDVRSPEGHKRGEYVESLSFDPWHAPVEFRPLGNLQRARNHAYRVSVMARHAAPEPTGVEAAA
jgi:hypothetical protein